MAKDRSGFFDERKFITFVSILLEAIRLNAFSPLYRVCAWDIVRQNQIIQASLFHPELTERGGKGGRELIYKTNTSFLLAELYHQNREDSCPGVQLSFYCACALSLTQ